MLCDTIREYGKIGFKVLRGEYFSAVGDEDGADISVLQELCAVLRTKDQNSRGQRVQFRRALTGQRNRDKPAVCWISGSRIDNVMRGNSADNGALLIASAVW